MKRKMKNRRSTRGFTLVEMLVVLAILVLLVSMVAPRILGSQKKADINAAKTQIGLFKGALQQYYLDCKDYPSTEQGLSSLTSEPSDLPETVKWNGPYLEGELGMDPWGHEYQYEYPPTRGSGDIPDIWSMGPDGEDGSDDDIGNWTGSGSGSKDEGEKGGAKKTREPRSETRRDSTKSSSREPAAPKTPRSDSKERAPRNPAPVRSEPGAK